MLVLQWKVLLTKRSFCKEIKFLRAKVEVGFVIFLCNIVHVLHLGIPKSVGAETFFGNYKKLRTWFFKVCKNRIHSKSGSKREAQIPFACYYRYDLLTVFDDCFRFVCNSSVISLPCRLFVNHD